MRSATGDADIAAARDLTFHGMNALHYGRPDQAENLLSRAVEASPCDQRIRQHLASAMVQQGKVDLAIEQLEMAIDKSCQDPRLHVELGNLYLLKQQPATAAEHASVALRINRQNPCAWTLRGRCQEAQGDLESALASYHRAAGLENVDPQVQIHIAATYRRMGRPLQALNALQVYSENFASEQVPLDAILLTANTLSDLKQYQRATEHLAQATHRQDATPETWLALSRAHEMAGNTSAARLTARNAQQLFPNHVDLQTRVASLEQTESSVDRTASVPATNRY